MLKFAHMSTHELTQPKNKFRKPAHSMENGMSGKIRLHVMMTPRAYEITRQISDQEGVPAGEVISRALGLYNTAREAKKAGLTLGAAKDRTNLDREFVESF